MVVNHLSLILFTNLFSLLMKKQNNDSQRSYSSFFLFMIMKQMKYLLI